MYRRPLLLAMIMVILLAVAPMAQAITFGDPDGERHPNVGAMIVLGWDGLYHPLCSGTLIASNVFLTAAHCTAAAAALSDNPNDVFVTFDSVYDKNADLHRGTYELNLNYGHDRHDRHDVAVIILDKEITEILPAKLPPAGLLTDMKNARELKGQQFVAVGYGSLRNEKARGPHAIGDAGERYFAEQTFQALEPHWLQLSMNPSTGNGGTCYGDSGGPHFLGDSDIVVSLTVTGDTWCRATDVTYRLDTESVLSYLSQWVDLPQ